MRKITLILAFCLASFLTHAQDFPDPYCDIDDDDTTIEEITLVELNDTSIENDDDTAILIDKTDTEVSLSPGETYTLNIEGDTKGDFDNAIVAYIDWNQNGTLGDEGEVYELGLLSDSDGQDGTQVSAEITVPEDAEEGATRIRITKTFTDDESPAVLNPCAIEMDAFGMGAYPGYGQAIDFTANIGDLGLDQNKKTAITVYPNPSQNQLYISAKTEMESAHMFNLIGQQVLTQKIDSPVTKLDITDLSPGMYILQIISANGQKEVKVIKE